MISLSKQPKINLSKGQTINLTKDGSINTEKLDIIYFGVKWGKIKKFGKIAKTTERPKSGFFNKLMGAVETVTEWISTENEESVDLDASVLVYDDRKNLLQKIYYGNRYESGIKHYGDDLNGSSNDTDVDNETIKVQLSRVSNRAKYLVCILNSFRHHKFDKLPYMGARIYTGKEGNPDEVLCAYNIENNPDFKNKEAIVLGYFYKDSKDWKFKTVGNITNEKSIPEMASGSALEAIK